MKKVTNIITKSTPFALALCSAYAQEDAGSVTVVGDESILSATVSVFKTDTPLIDIPRSLSIIDSEQIDNQAVDNISDLIDYTPGVTVSQGEGHRDAVVFRGTRSTADFFVNGVRDDVQYYRSLYNLDKVEILRGPSALFFGRGGSGGVLNRVTKTADTSGNYSGYKASVDSFGGTDAQLDINYAFSDNVALRVNAFNETIRNHRDFVDGDRFGFNPTLYIKLSEKTTLDVSYEFSDHQQFIDRGIPSINGRPAEQFSDITFGDSELNLNDFEGNVFTAKLNHNISDNWNASATVSYGNYNKTYTNFFPSDFDAATNQVEIDGYRDVTDRETFTYAADLVGNFNTGSIEHKFVLGTEFIVTDSETFRFNNVFDSNGDDQQFFDADGFRLSNGVVRATDGTIIDSGTFSDLNDDTESDLDVFSIYFQDEIKLHDKLNIVLGARFDNFSIDVANNDPDADPADVNNSNSDSEISPKFGIVYKPIDSVSIYGSYTESFLPRSGEQFADINGDDAALDADEFSNIEFGVKWNINDRLLLSTSLFQVEETSLSVNALDVDTLDQIESQVRGIEVQLQGHLTDYWHVSAGYSYLEGDVESGENDGNTLRELPQNTFSIWNQFSVTDKAQFGIGLVYQDEQFANDDNAVTLPSFVRFDASASYQVSDSLKLQLNVENLFDRDYFPSSHTNNNITVGAPINATFSVSKTF